MSLRLFNPNEVVEKEYFLRNHKKRGDRLCKK
jgi:hypothetical protein